MKTYSVKVSEIKREWHVIDASDKILGRLATEAAKLLMGKHKSIFCRHLDVGDFVVVLNAEKIRVSGDKVKQKVYYRHSGYPGGFKSVTLEDLMQNHPTRAVEYAVKGMLPHNRLGASMIKKLKVYVGDKHPHLAQTEGKLVNAESKGEK
jgi:large subunit ribosomal protein L13